MHRLEIQAAGRLCQATAIGKNIVTFSDGTGNSFAARGSDFWRLHAALDAIGRTGRREEGSPLARQVPWAGTSFNLVLRTNYGATGIGVVSSMRRVWGSCRAQSALL